MLPIPDFRGCRRFGSWRAIRLLSVLWQDLRCRSPETALPEALDAVLLLIGKSSLVLGLLAVGAGLDMKSVTAGARAMALGSVLKLLVLPVMVWGAGKAIGLAGTPAEVALVFAALPTASSAYILARMLGGDHQLMAGLITFQTIASFFSIPLVLMLFGA